MVLRLRTVLLIYGATVELTTENRFDTLLRSRLLKLDVRGEVPMFSEGKSFHSNFVGSPDMCFGQRISVQKGVCRVMMKAVKPHCGHTPWTARCSLFDSDEGGLFMTTLLT